jgi:sepiapterin reductase
LNYSPGPVQTEMLDTMIEKINDIELKNKFQNKKKCKEILTTDQTVNRFIQVLSKKNYKSGDHVDYYDKL